MGPGCKEEENWFDVFDRLDRSEQPDVRWWWERRSLSVPDTCWRGERGGGRGEGGGERGEGRGGERGEGKDNS